MVQQPNNNNDVNEVDDTFDEDDLIAGFIEVSLQNKDDFLKVKETLTRIGVSSKAQIEGKPKLYQSCHILHKRGKYYIVHFKELLELDGFDTNISEDDIARRNTIANLLCEWGLVVLCDKNTTRDPVVPIHHIKIIPFKEKSGWDLIPKYHIGKKKF